MSRLTALAMRKNPSSEVTTQHFRVTHEFAGQRLDRYLAAQMPQHSRTRLQELIVEGRALIAGLPARASHRVSEGESVQVEVASRPPLDAVAEDLPIEIIYQDDDLVVVNKPAGMAVHVGAGITRGTLVNALLHKLGSLAQNAGKLRPGIVHRLDRGTSGVMVVARSDRAHAILSAQFGARDIEKVYLALVHGRMEEKSGTIDLPVARDLQRRTRMTTKRREGRDARTDWTVLARLPGFSLLAIRLHTGRTHQIRVHMSAIGHPVVGDVVYGAPREPVVEGRKLAALGRPFLHAARLGFTHPTTGERLTFRAPLDASLRAYLNDLAAATRTAQGPIDAALKGYL